MSSLPRKTRQPDKGATTATASLPDIKNGRATSYDVARLAGVSQSAVSRCFQPGSSASRSMRERVTRAARTLGYTPNALARSLITRRSNLIAVLISNFTSLYYPEVLSELSSHASTQGERILLFAVPTESDIDQVLDQVLQYQVDGVIAAVRLLPAALDEFERRRIPLVYFNRSVRDRLVSSICCDQSEGARALVTRLHQAGHRRFGIIAGPEDSVVGEERLRGAQETLRELGIREAPVARGHYTYEGGRSGLHELARPRRRVPDAIICCNDVMAMGCIDAARFDLKLSVPEALSVVGFDGVGPASWASYRLTTIRQPVSLMAAGAVQLLLARIENPALPTEKRVLRGKLVLGHSARLS